MKTIKYILMNSKSSFGVNIRLYEIGAKAFTRSFITLAIISHLGPYEVWFNLVDCSLSLTLDVE